MTTRIFTLQHIQTNIQHIHYTNKCIFSYLAMNFFSSRTQTHNLLNHWLKSLQATSCWVNLAEHIGWASQRVDEQDT